MHVKMTRIENGVTVPQDLFTLYVNFNIVTAKIFWPPLYTPFNTGVKLGAKQLNISGFNR
jgi:hypothetical protein